MYSVVKRDGSIADFNLNRINLAITKAFEACGKQYIPDVIDLVALRVSADFQEKTQKPYSHIPLSDYHFHAIIF